MTIAFYEHPRSSYVQIGSGRWERGLDEAVPSALGAKATCSSAIFPVVRHDRIHHHDHGFSKTSTL